MTSVVDHYESHLAPVYVWMAGGVASALTRGTAEVEALAVDDPTGSVAVDLGAGFGMHAVPLARRGYDVLAIDASRTLLDTLRQNTAGLRVTTVEDDLLNFWKYLVSKARLVLCMGDTLTHLPDTSAVKELFARVAESLAPGGRFVLTFRDYSRPLEGEHRFIPVKSDADRILTCFLEYFPDHVRVHDLLHQRHEGTWNLRASAYRKLRLPADWVADALQDAGFETVREPGAGGMVRIVAIRC